MVSAGKQLATTFNELSAQLSTIAGQATEQYNALTGPSGEVEEYANQIAQLNGQIKLAEEAGQQPNDMLDRRDLLLDKLSSLAQVTVTEAARPHGHDHLRRRGQTAGRRHDRQLAADASPKRPAGELGALLGLTGPTGALTTLQIELERRRGNAREHRQRLTLATPFFSGTTAATLAVAVDSRRSAGLLDRSRGRQRSRAGNRRRCAAAPPNRPMRRSSSRSAATSRPPRTTQSNLQTTVTAINDQRQSVSGVSLDEEMTNLISFQRGYQASARTLTAMDEMLETLIEHTGTVGL